LFGANKGRADGIQAIPERNCQAIAERDQTRRQRAEALIEAGALPTAAHFYPAAMLFQHGDNVRDYGRGHELAKQAAESGTAVALAGGRSLRVSAGIRVGQ
jgi:hypothetical protein